MMTERHDSRQNSKAERCNGVQVKTRCLLQGALLPHCLWPFAMSWACVLYNHTPRRFHNSPILQVVPSDSQWRSPRNLYTRIQCSHFCRFLSSAFWRIGAHLSRQTTRRSSSCLHTETPSVTKSRHTTVPSTGADEPQVSLCPHVEVH